MAVSEKILRRIENLFRLAAPTSNTTVEERQVAALEAVELILKHGLTVRPEAEHRRTVTTVARGAWVLSQALQHVGCSHCSEKISRADIVWMRVRPDLTVEYRHNCDPCRIKTAEH